MTYSEDSPPPRWYDPPHEGFDCPTCVADRVVGRITSYIIDELYSQGVSIKTVNETLNTTEGLAFIDFCGEDVSLVVSQDGGRSCNKHQRGGE
jgi:hypothetical protein